MKYLVLILALVLAVPFITPPGTASACKDCDEVQGCYGVDKGGYLNCTFSAGRCAVKLSCTGCFLAGTKVTTPAGLSNIEELRIGDELKMADGRSQTVLNITRVSKAVRAYNIEVDGSHTFLASGIVVHNKSGGVDPNDP